MKMWHEMTVEEQQSLSYEELLTVKLKPKKRPPDPPPPENVVSLATANPEVPLERQRERIREAERKLAEDQWRILQEERRKARWLAERQAAIDFHMEMKLANEAAAKRIERDLDPVNCGLYDTKPCHR
jgi:hypothetical protein